MLDIAGTDLRGSTDKDLWIRAAEDKRIIITRDLDYPIKGIEPQPPAVMLLRVNPDYRADQITKVFRDAFSVIKVQDITNSVVVIAPGRIRISPLP